MKIAILGATSQIAKDLIISFSQKFDYDLFLFARRPEAVTKWLIGVGLSGQYSIFDFSAFNLDMHFDVIINFVGVGSPERKATIGRSIFNLTQEYDAMALAYIRRHASCRYIFLSSGAVFGSSFDKPVDENSKAVIEINDINNKDWYGTAKLYAECLHRSLYDSSIVDIRLFNYFSHTQDMSSRFFITDILQAIKSGETLTIAPDNIVRDYITPHDFFSLVSKILTSPEVNIAVDCYTKQPVDKMTLLQKMSEKFPLSYHVEYSHDVISATGQKMNYFSRNRTAERFGYKPLYSSLDGVLLEASKAVKKF